MNIEAQEKYSDLINNAKLQNRSRSDGKYYEKHHIIPRSLDGDDTDENLVLLTAEEHFYAHQYLYEMYDYGTFEHFKMAQAFNCMSIISPNHARQSALDYDYAKNAIANQPKEFFKDRVKSLRLTNIVELYHPVHGEFKGTCYDLNQLFPSEKYSTNALTKVFKEKKGQHKDWVHIDFKDDYENHIKNIKINQRRLVANDDVFEFWHDVHGKEVLSVFELALKYNDQNLSQCCLQNVAKENHQRKHKGWMLFKNKGIVDKIIRDNVGMRTRDKTIVEFYHREHGYFKGTTFELSNKFYDKTDSNFIKLIKEEISHYKGWVLFSNKNQYDELIENSKAGKKLFVTNGKINKRILPTEFESFLNKNSDFKPGVTRKARIK